MLTAIVVVLTAVYPFLVYFGLAHLKPGMFGVLLAALILLRLLSFEPALRRRLLALVALMTAYALVVAVTNSERLLRFYPVLMNLLMFSIFFASLRGGMPILERIARWKGMHVSEFGVPYLRKLTWVWCAFFVASAAIAAWTVFMSDLSTWAFYNGFVVYVIMGILLAGEWLFRRHYKRRVGIVD